MVCQLGRVEFKMSETIRTMYIGHKPLSAYLQACYFTLEKENVKELRLLAMGRSILTAINVASILQRNGGKINSIGIGSEKKKNYPGYVSTIEIEIEVM